MRRHSYLALLVAGTLSATAHAGLWENIYTALDYAATPSGYPVFATGDGTRVNGARSGRVRIVPNGVVGSGYRLEFDRTFGVDSRGRGETFRFGSEGELRLQGTVQMTAGYTSSLLSNKDSWRGGELNLQTNNLSYGVRTKLGAQDVELTGTLNMANTIEVNPLGFYNARINVSNSNSQVLLDGVVVRDADPTNFDIGPIDISGNIYIDALGVFLGALGVDTSALEDLFPRSPIDRLNDEIQRELQAAQSPDTALAAGNAALLLDTVLGRNDAAADELVQRLIEDPTGDIPASSELTTPVDGTTPVPEPGTLLLLTLGGVTLWSTRRR